MAEPSLHVVTGAFGYSGRYIAARLLRSGLRVRTLTNSPRRRDPFDGRVEVRPMDFADRRGLVESLRGVAVLYNTYWVRFDHADFSHAAAVRNTLALFEAAREVRVRRVVHVSITNASEDSDLPYFRGKGRLERALIESGLTHSILRPAVLFGKEDVLVNNIAWAVRRFPVVPVFGRGDYRLQPIHVEDLARLAVEQGRSVGNRIEDNRIINVIGPETFTYRELVKTIAAILGRRRLVVGMPPSLAYLGTRVLGRLLGDVMITREEVRGLMAGLLAVDSPPTGSTRLTEWAREHADSLGRRYASELARRKRRDEAYEDL